MPGGKQPNIRLKRSSQAACKSKATPKCVGFTFAQQQATCWLYDAISGVFAPHKDVSFHWRLATDATAAASTSTSTASAMASGTSHDGADASGAM